MFPELEDLHVDLSIYWKNFCCEHFMSQSAYTAQNQLSVKLKSCAKLRDGVRTDPLTLFPRQRLESIWNK